MFMRDLSRLLMTEAIKLRRSAALRLVWLLPLLFLLLEFIVFERPVLGFQILPPKVAETFDTVQLQTIGALWGAFFHPLLVALLPALLFRPEHRFKLWRHLHSLPVSRRVIFAAKFVWLLSLSALSLGLIGLGLLVERSLLARFNSALAFPFHANAIGQILLWLWIGSLPLLALYSWLSDRINSLAVPIVLGLVGLMLTISLSGAEVPKPWKRDLIPWVLPYFCGQSAIEHVTPRQTAHFAARMFQEEPNVLRLPNGKRIKTWQNIPDDVLFPPPAPTPRWVFGGFSFLAALLIFSAGVIDAGRNRT